MSDSLLSHGLYSPWISPGQNTGVGSHEWIFNEHGKYGPPASACQAMRKAHQEIYCGSCDLLITFRNLKDLFELSILKHFCDSIYIRAVFIIIMCLSSWTQSVYLLRDNMI